MAIDPVDSGSKRQADGFLESVVAHGYCLGCGICAGMHSSEKVAMRLSPTGYLRPAAQQAITVGQIERIRHLCPGMNVEHESDSGNHHAIWGPIKAVRTGHATDDEIRRLGSSGGVLTALALHLIESGEVDFVAQIAASQSAPLVNEMQLSRSRADVLHAAGSRYSPTAPLERFEELLATGENFAFIAKPCDVSAVRRMAQSDPRIGKQVRYLLSFMCAGIPSIHGTHEMLEHLGVASAELKEFRYRGNGWPGMAAATTHDGRVAEMDYHTSWGTILNRHLQFRCKICPDGSGEFADVVCADAWYGKDGYPDFQEREGRSLVISRTQSGEVLISEAVNAGAIKTADLPVAEIAAMQPYQVNRKRMVLARTLGAWLRLGSAPRYRRLGLVRASLGGNPITWLRECWGSFKRAKGESA